MSDRAALSRAQIIEDIADALFISPQELTDDTDLFEAGLDSVRLMTLIEKWRAGGSTTVDFPTLAADPVVGDWVKVISGEAAERP